MSKTYNEITPPLAEWIRRQRIFFVATAPLAGDGLVNCSPKGMDTFRILSPTDVAYLDLTGSGVETAAHLQENGRIVFMFCAFDGDPKIVRLHGTGRVVARGTPEYEALRQQFPDLSGTRSIVRAKLSRIGDSCGLAVPYFDFVQERDGLAKWCGNKSDADLQEYRRRKNANSLDGLPGLSQ